MVLEFLYHIWDFIYYILSFIIVISILVFVHEMGHYLAAKFANVRVEKFSIGMGKAICHWRDKSGTQWCIGWLPVGGYVQMFGDSGGASAPDQEKLASMNNEEKNSSFYFKSPLVKAWIAFAGPLVNYIFAIILLTPLYFYFGALEHSSLVTSVVENSPASNAGLLAGDKIIKIDDQEIEHFSDIAKILNLYSNQEIFQVKVKRDEEEITFAIKPEYKLIKTEFGDERKMPMIGVGSDDVSFIKLGFGQSVLRSITDCYQISAMTLIALKQIILGQRGFEDLSGPVKIAEYSGKTMKKEIPFIMWFLAMLSINLGLINLLPLPALDGGHVLLNLIEFFSGKSLKTSVQEWFFKIGFFLLISLMIIITIKDILGLL